MEVVGGWLIAVAFIVLVFLIFRALVLWYWKLDKIVALLERVERNTNPNPQAYNQPVKTRTPSSREKNLIIALAVLGAGVMIAFLILRNGM